MMTIHLNHNDNNWEGNGRLWKRCGLSSIIPGTSSLSAQDLRHGDEHRSR